MSAPPNRDAPSNPGNNRDNENQFPEKPELPRFIRRWFRGFHLNREKSKVTDYLTVGLTLLIALAAFWSAWIFQGQLDEAQRSTRLAVRPWIGLDEGLQAIENTPLQIDAMGNANLVYTIRAKNYSNAPASNVWADANLVVADDLNTVYEQQGYACGDAVIGKPDIGLVLFQGKDRVFNSQPAIAKVNQKHQNSLFGVWLAGCIGYRDQFNYLCRTRFIWAFQPDDHRVFQAPIPAGKVNGHFVASASGEGIDACQLPKYDYGTEPKPNSDITIR
jgi:hypothetical protein